MPGIFISYRRADNPDAAGRIYDRLVSEFGRAQVFKDVDSIPLGQDFRAHLNYMIGECTVVLVLIGPRWSDLRDEAGARRLESADDFVRIEIEAAFARSIAVVPVLVGHATMPTTAQLPSPLAPLAYRQAIEVRPDPDFHHDATRLVAALRPMLSTSARLIKDVPGRAVKAEAPAALSAGMRLGAYEIMAPLGAGGMGEVYRARDTKLHREVAIKVLPASFASDPDRLARFEREARMLAALNHPHIGAIYGVEEHNDIQALVLELVEGEALAERLQRGPVPLAEAIGIARQIAEALDAAHEQGIIHRDLKPANIRLKADGSVKVLDFGIAKAMAGGASSGPPPQTLTVSGPEARALLGTAAYMSPEQARGQVVDKRTDIWSFGCVLYEMLTARTAFSGATFTDTLAAVIEREPEWNALPASTPAPIRQLLRRCLAKPPARRLRDLGDAALELESASAGDEATPNTAADFPRRRVVGLTAAACATAFVAVIAAAAWWRPQPAPSAGMVRLSLPLLGRPSIATIGSHHLAISQDGLRIAYSSQGRLWIRRIDAKDAVPLSVSGSNPFFSPNGKWIALWNQSDLVKVPVDDGEQVIIATTTERPLGGAWATDGTIVYATTEGLHRVPALGGEPQLLVKPDRQKEENLYAWPQFLPGERYVLFTIVPADPSRAMQIAVLDMKTLEISRVLQGGSFARYASGGHLVFAAGSALKTIQFDLDSRATRGEASTFPDVELGTSRDSGAAEYALSAAGTLVFLPERTESAPMRLVWVDRHGNEEALPVEPRPIAYAYISPDGSRVALDSGNNGKNRDIWILDLKRLTQVRLTDGPTEDILPRWSPDGRRIYFASDRGGNFDVYSQSADGADSARLEFGGPGFQAPNSFTPDGTRLIVIDKFNDLALLNLADSDRRLTYLLNSKSDERLGELSPDGKWLAYESNEGGNQFEIFLRPFPDVKGRREKLSINGGRFPRWGPRGMDELYYVSPSGEMMAASVKLSPQLKLGGTTKLFDWVKPPPGVSGRQFDVSPIDGRFLITKSVAQDSEGPTFASVILNWAGGL